MKPHFSLKVRKVLVKSVQIVTEYTAGSLVTERTVLAVQTKMAEVYARTFLCKDARNYFPIFFSSFALSLVEIRNKMSRIYKLVPDPPWPQNKVSPRFIRASSSAKCEADETRK